MAKRPGTSASRPYTSGRPSTSAGDSGYYDREAQFTYSQDYSIDEEDEESEAEDVFAFGPPSTADQQRELDEQHQQPLAEQLRQHQLADLAVPYTPAGRQSEFSFSLASPALPSPALPSPVTIPAPTFDPRVYDRVGPTPGPSTIYPRHPYPLSPAESPPSTDSQSHDDNPYRLRRLPPTANSVPASSPPMTAATALSAVSSAISSREVHVSLAAVAERIDEEAGIGKGKGRRTLTPESSSFPSVLDDMDSRDGSIKMEYDLDDLAEEDSPYPEVRASVSNIDDPEMPTLTLRMWVTGLVLTVIAGAANTFFNFRQPAPSIMSTLLLLASHPVGKLFAYWLPITTYRLPRFLGGSEFSLNPGPWNIKEHTLVVMMANVAIGTPYSINIIVVAETNYGIRLGFWFNVVLVLATQLTGFGLAGLCRRFLVWPASMVWPADLVICTMLNTLHAEEDDDRGGITRFKFFVWVAGGAFFFWFFPGYLFTALSVFSWVCWIAPDNIPVNQIFGVVSGLGFSVLTFDWTEISWLGSPLVFPWWAEVHVFAGFVLIWWILAPALYYSNVWNLAYFPMLANNPYDKFGNLYDVTRVLNSDGTFNSEAYNNYSPLYLPASYAITYLIAFALASCLLVHTVLYYGQSVINGFKRINVEKDDIHAKLMRAYPEVPDWWYLASFCFFFSLAIVAVEVWHTGIPVWCLLLSVALPVLYILPSGYILAMTSQVVTLNLPAQVIPGMLLPGDAFANMVFKSYSIQTLSEAQSFVQDLKLGHYIKVPPRATFIVQLVSTLLVGFVQVGVKEWMFANITDICSPHQADFLTCPHNQVLYTASAIWGLIGPTRQFGVHSIYHPQLYALIVGAVLPIPFWLYHRKYPSSWANLINTPILLNGVAYIPPAVGINYSSWFLVGFIFQFIIRRRNFAWWSKFNYVTSAAMDSGTSISVLFIFFALEFPKKGTITVNWWGNSVWQRTADFMSPSLLKAPSTGLT